MFLNDQRVENRNNICPRSMSDSEFRKRITNLFLDKDWYISISMNQEQANTCIYNEIRRYYKHRTLKCYYRFLKQKVLTILK